jgi:hypothetical protein
MKQEKELQNRRLHHSSGLLTTRESNPLLLRRKFLQIQYLLAKLPSKPLAKRFMNCLPFLTVVLSFSTTSEFCDSLLNFIFMKFPDFEALLRTYPASKIEEYQRAYSLKASLLGKIASQRLVEQEEVTKKLSEDSRKLKREYVTSTWPKLRMWTWRKRSLNWLKLSRDAKMKRKSQKMGRGLPRKPLKIPEKNLKSCRRLMTRI